MNRCVLLLLCCLAPSALAEEPAPLKLTKTIPLPDVKGRFDHFAIDVSGHRLFVAALGNNTLEVVDVVAGKRLKSIPELRKPAGVLYLPESNQIAVANGDDGTLKFFNAASYALVTSLGPLDDADNVRSDRQAKFSYVGYGDGALGVIDLATMKQTGTIKLAAHPESFQLEKEGSRIFVNVPAAKHVAVIDRASQSVTVTWPLTEFKANFPMALDEASRRLFVGCRQPARLAVLDTTSGTIVASLAISGDTDDLFYDAARRRVYLSCGEGFLDVIQGRDGDRYEPLARLATRAGARTCFFSPELNALYLAVPQRNGRDAEIRVYMTNE